MSETARRRIGFLIRWVQTGRQLAMPDSRPMPTIGGRCHELRVGDSSHQWRVIYRVDTAELIVADVFLKKTRNTPDHVVSGCRRRLAVYDRDREETS